MKNILFFLSIFFTSWGCKKNNSVIEPVQVEKEIHTPVKPIADFSFEVFDNGEVKFINKSMNASEINWSIYYYSDTYLWETYSQEKNPLYTFENNGEYSVTLHVTTDTKEQIVKSDTKQITIKITNAKGSPLSEFNGLFFNKSQSVKKVNQNTFDATWGLVALSGNSCNSFSAKDFGQIFIINASTRGLNLQEKYEKLKGQFKVGKVPINQFDVRFSKETVWGGALKDTFILANDPNAQLEITKVEEINQPKLIPEMYEKAFWVTFKIKADFGNGNNIDGTLRVRYLIY